MNHPVKTRREWGLFPGEIFPINEFTSVISGEPITVHDPAYDACMIVLTSVGCAPCRQLDSILAAYQEKHRDLKLILLIKGSKEEVLQEAELYGLLHMPIAILTDEIMAASETSHYPLAFLAATGFDPSGNRKLELQKGLVLMRAVAISEEHLDIIESTRRLPLVFYDLWT